MGITIQTGITDGSNGITPSQTGITRYGGITAEAGSEPSPASYVTEDGMTDYVAEDGTTFYVQE